jgi:hypothetical protein
MTSKTLANKRKTVMTMLAFALMLSMSAMLIQKAAAPHNTTIASFAFTPPDRIVPRGGIGGWINNDPVIHTLWFTKASDGSTYLVSDPINPGASWSHTFNEYVRLQYYDLTRLWISGTLLVTIPGDVNGDKTVNIGDLVKVKYHWYPGPPIGAGGWNMNTDINADGATNIADLVMVKANWGKSW